MNNQAPQNKMIADSEPATIVVAAATTPIPTTPVREWHFSGQGIWHNASIVAETIQEATKLWLEVRRLINKE